MKFARTAVLALAASTTVVVATSPTHVAADAPTELFISEYVEGSSNNKALEIYNGTDAAVDLTPYSVVVYFNGSSSAGTTIDLVGTVAAGDVFVVADNDAVLPLAPDQTSTSNFWNGDDAIALLSNGTAVDVFGQVGFDPGAEWGSDDTTTQNHTLRRISSVCAGDSDPTDPFDPSSEWQGFNQDTFDGLGDHTTTCDDTGGGDDGPAAGDVVITEVMQDPSVVTDANGEWFEIVNTTDADIDLDGWTISDVDSDSHDIAGSVVVPAGGYAVLGNNADPGTNGGVSVAYVYTGIALANGVDEIILTAPDATEVDRIVYDGGVIWPDPTGASMSLDPGATNSVANDDGAAWCEATTPYGAGDLGTPGAGNPSCGGTPTGQPLPISEGFDDCSLAGWQIISVDADAANTWACSASFSNIDVNGFGDTAAADEWLITPALDLDAQPNDTMTFRSLTRFTDVGYPQLAVLYSTDYSGSGDPTSATWTEVAGTTLSAEDSNEWTDSGDVDLSAITGTSVHIAFRYVSSGTGSGTAANWRLDAVEIFEDDGSGGGDPVPAKIHEIQGSGPSVAITTPVEVQAVVTSLFTRDDVLDGFFIQEEDADVDTGPEADTTSEGIFVFCRGTCPADLAVGDLVTVTGTPVDFQGMSQIDITDGTLTPDGTAPLPAATALDLPASGSTSAEATFESTEGMIVAFPDTLVVSEYFAVARADQIVLTESSRPYQYTHANAPDVAGYNDFLTELATRRIILDDDNNDENDSISDGPDEAQYYPSGGLATDRRYRGGDTIAALTGVLHWSWGGYTSNPNAWRVRPIDGIDYTFTPANPAPPTPEEVGGALRVASFNVLNLFSSIDDPSLPLCGPSSSLECRGADSPAELTRQHDKIVAALAKIDAAVVGLLEIENDEDQSAADLVAELNAVVGAGTYDHVATGFIGTDAIKTALIYQPEEVSPVGDVAILDSSVDPTFLDDKNRPVLVQTFEEVGTGERFTVAVNHFKSKGSDCNDVGDPDSGDGQGNCAGTRTDAANALASYLATDPTGSGDADFLILGDLNSYAMEDPIVALETAGYTDLLEAEVGENAYSYVFDGQLGYLDYAMANQPLLGQVTGATAWHINADEVPVFDYNDDTQDPSEPWFERKTSVGPLYDPDELRSSDHDPVIVGLDLDTPAPPWDPSATYGAGDLVSYGGAEWEALWWTSNQQPGNPYGPWQEMAENEDGVAIWTPSRVFDDGDQVVHEGALYEADWWTRNQEPGNPYGPWREIATTTDGTAIWTASQIYVAGDRVLFAGDLYEARWWNRNQPPGGEYGPWSRVT